MAEIVFVGAVVTVLVEKLVSVLAEQFIPTSDLLKLARSEGIDSQLNKWKKTLPLIQAVLADATQKQITDRGVQLWVKELQDVAYDIEDVLDDLATETLRRNFNQEASSSSTSNNNVTGKALKFLPNCCTNFTPRNIKFRHQMSSKLDEITTKLRDLVDQKNGLGLNVNVEKSNITDKRKEETTSLVKEPKIMGREGDKEVLLGKLLGNGEGVENVKIVSIVGMGGIGKTTLAQVLYNDEKVINHFEVRAWVCVSEEWDVFNISKAIFQAVTKGENKDFANLDLLHVALKKELSNKRFLIVLDDVWNKDYNKWELLRSPLLDGAPGSRVIVTTRNTDVANAMGSQEEERHSLKVLSYEDALSLFALHAIDETNFEKHPTFKPLGERIVKKCRELPLALKMLGRALSGNKNVDEWKDLLESGIWDDGNEILPALRLSYYHLPSHLKRLFAYCSLIPKDYVFDKNKLVLLWMAQGFLSQSNGNMSMERLGHKYFDDLKPRSFFQHSTKGESGYTMHDLINDLAASVAGEFSCRSDAEMDVSDINEPFEKFRHFSLVGLRSESCRQLKEVQRAKCLRTFLLMSPPWEVGLLDNVLIELIPKLQFLRVLSIMELTSSYIPWYEEMITKVPQSIGSLKHLRYLNFSYTGITCLPEQVSKLYNLQSLLVHNCRKLSTLPESFAKLINLRHLDISDTPELKKMPLGIAGLTSLQTLPKVIVEEANRFKISDLQGLSDLQGRLSITGLEKVIDPTQAMEADLHKKERLDVLEMEWSDELDDSRNAMIEDQVLEKLRPPPKIKKLNIRNYKGTRFPSWIGDHSFNQLTELTLSNCLITQLPTLGSVGSLRLIPPLVKLRISDVEGLTQLVHGEDLMHLRALERIKIERCDELRHLWERDSEACKSLVNLQKLEVRGCKKLVSLAAEKEKEDSFGFSMKSLKQVRLEGCDTLESYSCPNSVERLHIKECGSMTSLSFSAVQQEHPSSIVDSDCDNIQPQPPISPLKFLWIFNCKNLKSISHEHFHSLTGLEEMWIEDCPSMDNSFPCGMWPPNLRRLWIGGLKKPMSEWGIQNFPTSLVQLTLYGRNSGVVSFAVTEDVRNTTTPSSSSSCFLLPPSLVSLKLWDFEEVESFSEVLQHLPSLKTLDIFYCPKIRDIKETSDPSSNLRITVVEC